MTDAQYTSLPQWPSAYPASGATATLKHLNEDFIVTELPLQLPSGAGEHIWLEIEKNGANTAFVAQQLAEAAGVPQRAGLVEEVMAKLAAMPANFRSSMSEDLARGKPLELNWLSGRIHALGQQLAVPTPAHSTAWRALVLYVDGKTDF